MRADRAWAAKVEAALLEACHPKQREFVADPGRRVAARVGRGGGKTTGWLARALIKATRVTRARIVFIATTRVAAEELIWERLKTITASLGIEATFNETKLRCTIKRTAATIRLVGADDKREIDKLRGQSFHEVGIDEMASHPPDLLEALIDRVIAPRLGDVDGVICMFGTPGHILRGPAYEATKPSGSRHRPYRQRAEPEFAGWLGWSSHHWTLKDAADAGIPAQIKLWEEALREKAEKQWGDDNPIWLREYMGEWAADNTDTIYKYRSHAIDGQPWNQWDPERVGPMRVAELPPEMGPWSYAWGTDMGHSDPFALVVWAYSPRDRTRTLYHVFEFERPRMYAQAIAQLVLGVDDEAPLKCCSHDAPSGLLGALGWPDAAVADVTALGGAVLEELQRVYGVRFTAAKQKDKFAAIEQFNGWLIDGRVKVLKGSQLEQQLTTLQWQVNEFGEMRENKSQSNHTSDAGLYGAREVAASWDAEVADRAKSRRDLDSDYDQAPPRPHDLWGERDDFRDEAGEFADADL